MAHEKDERAGAGSRRPGDSGEDTVRRGAGSARSAARESGSERAGAESREVRGPAGGRGRRRERFLIGARMGPGGQPLGQPPHSMDEVAEYLSHQDDVEVVQRLRLGGPLPFSAQGRSVNEVLVAKIEEGKAQRLRAAAPASLIIERDALLTRAHNQSLTVGALPIGAYFPDPLRGGAGVPDLLRVPAGPGFTPAIRRADAEGLTPGALSYPPPQGWPAWLTMQGPGML